MSWLGELLMRLGHRPDDVQIEHDEANSADLVRRHKAALRDAATELRRNRVVLSAESANRAQGVMREHR